MFTESFTKPIAQIIQKRFSCRTYLDRPIDKDVQQKLAELGLNKMAKYIGAA